MDFIKNARWIKHPYAQADRVLVFEKEFCKSGDIKSASLEITALGVYEAKINGKRVGDFILAPGWTSYETRLQVQSYDVTELLGGSNNIDITVGQGWRFRSAKNEAHEHLGYRDTALLAALKIEYTDGSSETIVTDSTWTARESKLRCSSIYNGDIYDATFCADKLSAAEIDIGYDFLIDQQGEEVTEHERIAAKEIIITPKGETVIDFGQEVTGYVEFTVKGEHGKEVVIDHGEILDKDGNFYNANYRSAKAQIRFTCDGEQHTYKPSLTFFGFRYIRLTDWQDEVKMENFTAVVVHSDIKRTGYFECSNEEINKLFKNVIWGQKGNFLDIPTDCPQRDERLGWTGDAQVFVKTASLNFNVEKFFKKWLSDVKADQKPNGAVPHFIPAGDEPGASSAWGDAAVICPWQIYMTYGHTDILKDQLESMCGWVDYLMSLSEDYIVTGGTHYADWLGLDAGEGSYKGATSTELISTAYLAYSSRLLMQSAKVLGVELPDYEHIPQAVRTAFINKYMENGRVKNPTQTACAVAIFFDLTDNKAETAKQLNELVQRDGHLMTGFVGTPYILHALSDNGYAKTAYDLLLRREYPSWLYPVTKGATTIWEHWDGIKPDGSVWSTDMNSYNHYAYGAVADWMYGVMAGINTDPAAPAFEHIIFRPITDERISFVKAEIETKNGKVAAEWHTENGKTNYKFTVPEGSTATIILNGESKEVGAGEHCV